MLYRHVQPLFLSTDYSARLVRGPSMRVRPLDSDAPDHLMRFVLWGALKLRSGPPATPTRAANPKDPAVVVTAPPPPAPPPAPTGRPQLLIEMSADGEGWVVQSALPPRERPYLITIAHMLRYLRVRLEPNGTDAQGYALVIANAPFELEGRSPVIDPNVIVVTGSRR